MFVDAFTLMANPLVFARDATLPPPSAGEVQKFIICLWILRQSPADEDEQNGNQSFPEDPWD